VTFVIVLTVPGRIETSLLVCAQRRAERGPCLVAASWMVARGELTCLSSKAGLDVTHRRDLAQPTADTIEIDGRAQGRRGSGAAPEPILTPPGPWGKRRLAEVTPSGSADPNAQVIHKFTLEAREVEKLNDQDHSQSLISNWAFPCHVLGSKRRAQQPDSYQGAIHG
jgi:hypothetical protein